jgi:transposase InsO family protein
VEDLVPRDHGEEIAVFRSQVIGQLVHRTLTRGELKAALEELSKQFFRPPGAQTTRRFSVPTLERWYYRFRNDKLLGLRPRPRSDRGHAQVLDPSTREMILAVRREHPSASARLILRTLVRNGHVSDGAVSTSTIRRLLQDAGLDRTSLSRNAGVTVRLRWEAERPGALWHGDVCHGPIIGGDGRWVRPRIHALLDDKSRYVVAIDVQSTECEADMLALFVAAIRRWGRPDALYLDNGSTYSGLALATACARLGTSLLHARPYDPQARGKMERFWRTLREQCLDHLSRDVTLGELRQRLQLFLAQHYHLAPHEGLFGDTPGLVWEARQTHVTSESALADALTTEKTRRVSRDGVVSVDGELFEVRHSFLAGHRVTVRSCLVEGLPRIVEVVHDGKRYSLKPLDRVANGKTPRPPRTQPPPMTTRFDPTDPQPF